ncbi:MAG: hypothetical protein LBT65_04000 [Synergistaceae bacterium]|nr:hypothetical protein [Synergistaceae bacterium]
MRHGDIFGIIGVSGAGKSMLVQCINMPSTCWKGRATATVSWQWFDRTASQVITVSAARISAQIHCNHSTLNAVPVNTPYLLQTHLFLRHTRCPVSPRSRSCCFYR